MRPRANQATMLLYVFFLALQARAQYGGGTGEPNDPYLIYTAEQMNAIGAEFDHADRCFRLMADIDLSGYAGNDFHLIGTGRLNPRHNFTGAFDGNGHAISNFSHTAANRDDVGLFRFVRGAQIKDLTLINPNVDAGAGSTVGALVGYVDSGGTITNCHVEGGSVSGGRFVGGLAGRSKGTIVNSSATSNVSVIKDVGGGLVGESSGLISHCWSAGNVLGEQFVGGLVGGTEGSLVTDCYALGGVSGVALVGGLVGFAGESVVNCYAAGSVSGTTDIGGLVGVGGHTVVDSFWDIHTSGQSFSHGGTGRITAEMMDPNTFLNAGWNFVGTHDGPGDSWAKPDGGYPILWWQLRPVPELPAFSGGTGTPDDPYLISTADDLNCIGDNPRLMAAHFKLVADIELANNNSFMIGGRWHPFSGTFDGNGHTVSNFSHSCEYANSAGFFGRVKDGRISGLGLINPVIDVERGDFHGGLVGHLDGGIVTDCYVEAVRISGNDHVGGLVGKNDRIYWTATISRCYATGYVTGDDDVGGLVGSSNGIMTDCYSTAEVRGNKRVGGLVGTGPTASGGHAGHARIIERCFAAGRVSGDEDVGGLIGQGTYGANSFWDIESSGQPSRTGGQGKTTAEMQTAGTFLDAGWDFVDETENGAEDIWCICEVPGYPTFAWMDFRR